MLTVFLAPDLATIRVDTPEPSSTTNRGLCVRTKSEIVKSRSGDAAQLRVGGIGAENLRRLTNCEKASLWRYDCKMEALISLVAAVSSREFRSDFDEIFRCRDLKDLMQ
jgi:hypothetical protein